MEGREAVFSPVEIVWGHLYCSVSWEGFSAVLKTSRLPPSQGGLCETLLTITVTSPQLGPWASKKSMCSGEVKETHYPDAYEC